jgi:hypothetical protein
MQEISARFGACEGLEELLLVNIKGQRDKELSESLGCQPERKRGPQSYSCKKSKTAKSLSEIGSDLFPRTFR